MHRQAKLIPTTSLHRTTASTTGRKKQAPNKTSPKTSPKMKRSKARGKARGKAKSSPKATTIKSPAPVRLKDVSSGREEKGKEILKPTPTIDIQIARNVKVEKVRV